MTTPETITHLIEQIEQEIALTTLPRVQRDEMLTYLLHFKQSVIRAFNLPTADSPDESAGKEDMG